MIHKTPSPQRGHVRIIFELPACIWADRIFLVGDFNDWQTSVTPFLQGRDGVWRVVLDLPCGQRYQFRYLVDGNWQTDYHADGWVTNDFGSQNSIIEVGLPVGERSFGEQGSLVHEALAEHKGREASGGEASLSPLMKMVNSHYRVQSKAAG